MDTLKFIKQLAFDLEAGARAEDFLWATVVENMPDDQDDWLGPEETEKFLNGLRAGKE